MTYVFHPLQCQQASKSFGAGAKEGHRPPIGAAAFGWCRALFVQERRQCDRVVGRSGTTHGGTHALGRMGRHGRSRGTFEGHEAAGDIHDATVDSGADRAKDRGGRHAASHDPTNAGEGSSSHDRWVIARHIRNIA